ncbi:hypothetical protein C9J12_21230 [Photobacterium frigidiphilum]|uniref:Type II secretion system protein n=1 Tax=Photobacterium frigidiphilum TaxID=264736 RepID=A0A2T3JAD0_9GAMM|nr:hypothetical protein [Photobacterium frigidiphilum]PSU45765.1 hypothetical protein C9J12_21230 [Photobacterium frigidiphilum]
MREPQKGFMLYGLLLTLAVLAGLVAYGVGIYTDSIRQKQAERYADHLVQVAEQLQNYQYYKVTKEGDDPWLMSSWPASWEGLMTDYRGSFWLECTDSEQSSGLCSRPDYAPWSTNKLEYHKTVPSADTSFFVITIPLSELGVDTKSYRLWLSPIQKIPNVKLLLNGDAELRVGRTQMATVYKEFLQRDGSTELTGDWDVGGKNGFVNVKDITMVNADGSQTSVAAGLIRSQGVAKHGEWVNMPSCPLSLRPTQSFSFAGNIPNTISNDFNDFGPAKTYVLNQDTTRWQIGLDYVATKKSDKRKYTIHSGVVNYFTFCR